MFSNIGQLNISGGSGYGIQANNVESLMVIKNTFRNAKAVMIPPCTGTLTQSGYVEGNIWNPQQFFNTTNITNNPQSNLGFTFNTVINGFPSIINTDIIRKTFNLENIGTDFTTTGGTAPNYNGTPKSIIARKTSLGWIAKQAVWINGSSFNNNSITDLMYWLIPFQEFWIDTANIAVYVKNDSVNYILYQIIPSLPAATSINNTPTFTNKGVYTSWFNIFGSPSAGNYNIMSIKIEVEGLVDIQKVINLTTIDQYLPSTSS